MTKKLTLAIPTYKRTDVVVALIDRLLEEKLDAIVDILLIDDAPSENLKDRLGGLMDRITFIVHEENKGYCNTFCELFENCNTEYVLVAADDDKIITEQLLQINKHLNHNSFDFLSTRWLRKNGKTYRGKNKCTSISLTEIEAASNHAPGLIYRVDAVIPLLPFLKERIRKKCQATFFYPQVIVLYLLQLQQKKCFWHPNAPVQEGNSCTSNLIDIDGNAYYSVQGRWKIYLDFIDLFNELQQGDFSTHSQPIGDFAKTIQALKIRYQQKNYKRIDSAVRMGDKDAWMNWVAESFISNLQRPFLLFYCICFWLKNWIKYRVILKKS